MLEVSTIAADVADLGVDPEVMQLICGSCSSRVQLGSVNLAALQSPK
jgi:hypothetical protein